MPNDFRPAPHTWKIRDVIASRNHADAAAYVTKVRHEAHAASNGSTPLAGTRSADQLVDAWLNSWRRP
jgi:hypothetical protein